MLPTWNDHKQNKNNNNMSEFKQTNKYKPRTNMILDISHSHLLNDTHAIIQQRVFSSTQTEESVLLMSVIWYVLNTYVINTSYGNATNNQTHISENILKKTAPQ